MEKGYIEGNIHADDSDTDEDSISHYSDSLIWKEDYKMCSETVAGNEFLFVSVIAFVDGYIRERFGRKCSDAIYVTLGVKKMLLH